MSKVKLNDGAGHWVDDDGKLMTTVWTSSGWFDLPEEYAVHDEFIPITIPPQWAPTGDVDDSLDLTIIIENEDGISFMNVVSADFDVIE